MEHYPSLQQCKIDVLYLDTTFVILVEIQSYAVTYLDFLLFIVTLRLSLSLVWHMIILKGLAILCTQALGSAYSLKSIITVKVML